MHSRFSTVSRRGAQVLASAIALASLSLVVAAPRAAAEPEPVQTVDEAFEDAFFSRGQDFMSNRSIGRQFAWILGFGFPENEATRDARAVNDLYREVSALQNASDPTIRTRDLPNPYNTSLLELIRQGEL